MILRKTVDIKSISWCKSIKDNPNHIDIIEPIFDAKSVNEYLGYNSYSKIGEFEDLINNL